MKKTTVIISILSVLVIALTGLLLYQSYNNGLDIVVSGIEEQGEPNKQENKPIDDLTLIPEDSVIIKEDVPIKSEYDDMKVKDSFDVIVFGAEPEGICTAISAARNGLRVMLVEKRSGPGGLMIYGMLNSIDMNRDSNGVLLSQGIFEEFFEKVGNRTSFDVETAKNAFSSMLNAEKNIIQVYDVESIEIGPSNTEIKYAVIDGFKYIAGAYIDCTQDADITAAAGASYTVGWEDVNEKNKAMSATLVIKMDNVNWDGMCKYIAKMNLPATGYTDYDVWAFGDITKEYVPHESHMRLKALNIGKQDDGSVLINSLQVLNVNLLDKAATQIAYDKCVNEASYVAKFLIANVPGFENATLSGVADELYIRETRHIIGENKLTVKDELVPTYSVSAIGMASYPIDLQTTSIYDWGYVVGAPDAYFLTLGMIIPKGYTNLLTIGRSSSYTSIAAGSARVIPTGMTMGESAGVLCALAKERNVDFQTILSSYESLGELQKRCKFQGVYIADSAKAVVDENYKFYSFIIEMCEKGILSLGYSNEFDENEIITETDFIVLLKTYLKRSFIRDNLWNTDHINLLDVPNKGITPNRIKEIIYDITTYNLADESKKVKIDNFLNLVVPASSKELKLIKVYEILIYFKDFLIRENI